MTEQRLPENYIDPSLSSLDQELLRIFYTASLSEGGSADEVTLRGIRAIVDWQLDQVIEWIWKQLEEDKDDNEEDVDFCYYITDNIVDELRAAMRPQQQQKNN